MTIPWWIAVIGTWIALGFLALIVFLAIARAGRDDSIEYEDGE